MSYQIMIGTPTADLEHSLTARFDEITECEVVSVHHSSREISDTLTKLPNLDVVLIHEDVGPLPVLDLVRDISRNHPQLAVILIVDSVDPDVFTNAMEAGARGVLSAGATIEELEARVTTAAEWSQTLRRHLEAASLDVPVSGRRGSIITVSGGKGGTGTTTTAVHLALTAARAGRVVCLVDLDLQTGDIPGYLDLRHRRSIVDLVEAADNISAAMLAETLYVLPEGVHILLAPSEGERGEEVTERAARQILGALRSRYEIVIVDCGSTVNESNAMAVELADTAIVTVTPDLPALRGAQRLVSMWGRLQVRDKKNVTALLLRHSRKNEIQPDFARKLLGTPMLSTAVPAAYRALEEASNTGDPKRVTDEALLKASSRLVGELGLLGDGAAPPADGDDGAPPQPDQAKAAAAGRRGRRGRSDGGALFVEFGALVPLLGLAMLVVWQVILVGITGMYAGHAANEGARQAAVTPGDFGRITEEARKRVHAPWNANGTFALDIEQRDDASYVTVSIAMPVVLPSTSSPWHITGESMIVPE
ncbi:pilus assembly protein CpaE [Spinactinospora alkalitolerans]|uniref:Pilus assembly protein CpaE n=1 Tax=Spinactinospora alkalitolerans TaxID=687207 RepID=A0A852U2J1_9ACTN|nr:AAA family ATPase [Spinactinospora alkalitolerans]NYE49163.1 pilus assembly protein CpaE [Spinactinospora alkalitolerans]